MWLNNWPNHGFRNRNQNYWCWMCHVGNALDQRNLWDYRWGLLPGYLQKLLWQLWENKPWLAWALIVEEIQIYPHQYLNLRRVLSPRWLLLDWLIASSYSEFFCLTRNDLDDLVSKSSLLIILTARFLLGVLFFGDFVWGYKYSCWAFISKTSSFIPLNFNKFFFM